MNELDHRLILMLRRNARRAVSDLAMEAGVSRATVRARLSRLEKQGDILGYTVVLKADATALPVRGVMMVEIAGHAADKVIKVLGGFPEVSTVHTTNGRWDLVLELATETLEEFDSVLRRIRYVPGITGSDTSLLLSTPRTTKVRPERDAQT